MLKLAVIAFASALTAVGVARAVDSVAEPRAAATAPVAMATVSNTETPGPAASISKAVDGHYWAEADVNGERVRFLVDTGATAVALTPEDALRLGFEPKDLDIDLLGTNNVTTLMGNLMFVGNAGSVRPYVTGGAGLIRSQIGEFGELFDATESSLGINAGAGLFLGSGRVSLRGDLRYFRNVSESDDPLIDEALKDMRFWRGTIGVSFGF